MKTWKIKIDSHVSHKNYTQEQATRIIEHLLKIKYGTKLEMFRVDETLDECYN